MMVTSQAKTLMDGLKKSSVGPIAGKLAEGLMAVGLDGLVVDTNMQVTFSKAVTVAEQQQHSWVLNADLALPVIFRYEALVILIQIILHVIMLKVLAS